MVYLHYKMWFYCQLLSCFVLKYSVATTPVLAAKKRREVRGHTINSVGPEFANSNKILPRRETRLNKTNRLRHFLREKLSVSQGPQSRGQGGTCPPPPQYF